MKVVGPLGLTDPPFSNISDRTLFGDLFSELSHRVCPHICK